MLLEVLAELIQGLLHILLLSQEVLEGELIEFLQQAIDFDVLSAQMPCSLRRLLICRAVETIDEVSFHLPLFEVLIFTSEEETSYVFMPKLLHLGLGLEDLYGLE